MFDSIASNPCRLSRNDEENFAITKRRDDLQWLFLKFSSSVAYTTVKHGGAALPRFNRQCKTSKISHSPITLTTARHVQVLYPRPNSAIFIPFIINVVKLGYVSSQIGLSFETHIPNLRLLDFKSNPNLRNEIKWPNPNLKIIFFWPSANLSTTEALPWVRCWW